MTTAKTKKFLDKHGLSKEEALDLLRQMWEIRIFENTVYDLLGRNIIKGASHLYAGQEAVAVGAVCPHQEATPRVDSASAELYPTRKHVVETVDVMAMGRQNVIGRQPHVGEAKAVWRGVSEDHVDGSATS